MQAMFKNIGVVLIGLLFSMQVLAASPAPDEIVRQVTSDLFAQLKTQKAAIQHDSNKLVEIVNSTIIPHTDLYETSKRVLAKHWRDLTPAQQQSFEKEFEKLLIRTYAVSFRNYDNQVVDILETRANPNNPNTVEVRTVIKEPGKSNLAVNYRFLKEQDGTWKVYDINVDNVSLVSSFRTQIGDAIAREGFDGMLVNMRAKNAEKF